MASKEFIAKLKEEINLVDLVAETVQLRRTGKYLTGLSPFTKEKTPSFFVNPESQSFYCYSTNQGGDAITFLELTKGFSFQEAVEFLAHRVGVPMEASNRTPEQIAQDKKREEERKLLLKLNRFAARFYQEQFSGPLGSQVRDYALKRGISQESLLKFGIGFAPDSWTALRDYFLKIKAPMLEAYGLGLFRTKGGEKPRADGSNFFDTFRNRLIFPIRDPHGEVLGFGGRWLGAASADAPKYLNSPESVVYEKEKVLYNLDQAKKSIREMESVVLVEGYMDCLSMVQAGFSNVVANCGTALTKPQVAILRRLAPKIICLYDSDEAGQVASERAMDLFLEADGFPLLSARLPDGKDPDDFLRAHGDDGPILMAKALQESPALVDLWAEKVLAATPTTVQARAEALDKIAKKLSRLRDTLWIQARIAPLASRLDLDPAIVIDAVQRYRRSFQAPAGGHERRRPTGQFMGTTAKSGPTLGNKKPTTNSQGRQKSKQFQARNGKSDFGFERRFLGDLIKQAEWLEQLRAMHANDPGSVLPFLGHKEVRSLLEDLLVPPVQGESHEERTQKLSEKYRDQPELRNLFAQASVSLEDSMPAKDLESSLVRLREGSLKRKAAMLQQQIEEAEKQGNVEASESMLQELTELRRQLR